MMTGKIVESHMSEFFHGKPRARMKSLGIRASEDALYTYVQKHTSSSLRAHIYYII